MEFEACIHSANTKTCPEEEVTSLRLGREVKDDHNAVISAVIRTDNSSTRC